MLDDDAFDNVGDVFATIHCGLQLFINFFPLQYRERIVLLMKTATRQLYQLAHPRSVRLVTLGDKPVAEEVLVSIMGFTILYLATTFLLTVGMMSAGLDLESAFGAVMATINLVGPGLGEVAATFTDVSSFAKWLGIIGMLIGRLEVFTLLILLMPAFWKA